MAKFFDKLDAHGKAFFDKCVELIRGACITPAKPTTAFLDQVKPCEVMVQGQPVTGYSPYWADRTLCVRRDGTLFNYYREQDYEDSSPTNGIAFALSASGPFVQNLVSYETVPGVDHMKARSIAKAATGWVFGRSPDVQDASAARWITKHVLNKNVTHLLFKFRGNSWAMKDYNATLQNLDKLNRMEQVAPGLIAVWYKVRGDYDAGSPMETLTKWRKEKDIKPAAWKWAMRASPMALRRLPYTMNEVLSFLALPELAHLRPYAVSRILNMWPSGYAGYDDQIAEVARQWALRIEQTSLCLLALAKTQPKRGIKRWIHEGISNVNGMIDMWRPRQDFDAGGPVVPYDPRQVKGCSWRRLLEISADWHRRDGEFQRELRAQHDAAYAQRRKALVWTLPVEKFEQGKLTAVGLTSGAALDEEADILDHCVHGYAHMCLEGKSMIYSVREGDKRISTVELVPHNGTLKVNQNRGFHNSPVSKKVEAFGQSLLRHVKSVLKNSN